MPRLLSVSLRKVETLASFPLSLALQKSSDSRRISGSGFAKLADARVYGRQSPSSLTEVKQAAVIYIYGHRIEEFLEEYGRSVSARVLILGDGDRDWETFNFRMPSSVRRIYLQNSMIPNDTRFQAIPIGIENREHGRNGLPHLFPASLALRSKGRQILIGPFGNTHPLRELINSIDYTSYKSIHHLHERVSSFEMARRASKFLYVAAPRGNGKDTHRFWESLYRGSLPIVENDTWADNMESIGIPLIRTSGWSGYELENAIRNDVSKAVAPSQVPALWRDYWVKDIRDSL